MTAEGEYILRRFLKTLDQIERECQQLLGRRPNEHQFVRELGEHVERIRALLPKHLGTLEMQHF